jgi:transposase InsO family protein
LIVIDRFTPECLALKITRSLPSQSVTTVLDAAIATRGGPRTALFVRILHRAFTFPPCPYQELTAERIGYAEILLARLAMQPKRTTYRSRWQNGVAERWVGSARRELVDHVIVFNEQHLWRLLRVGDLHHRYVWRKAA